MLGKFTLTACYFNFLAYGCIYSGDVEYYFTDYYYYGFEYYSIYGYDPRCFRSYEICNYRWYNNIYSYYLFYSDVQLNCSKLLFTYIYHK